MSWNPLERLQTKVTRRENRGHRVYYALHSDDLDSDMVIPEQIVLKRWRAMKSAKLDFHGCRLSPTIWRGLRSVDFECDEWEHQVSLQRAKIKETECHVKIPPTSALRAMRAVMGPEALGRLSDLGYSMIGQERFGTPDLFLWTSRRRSGVPRFASFVEVKKPNEPVSKDQKLMIWALKRLGANAQVLRLQEV